MFALKCLTNLAKLIAQHKTKYRFDKVYYLLRETNEESMHCSDYLLGVCIYDETYLVIERSRRVLLSGPFSFQSLVKFKLFSTRNSSNTTVYIAFLVTHHSLEMLPLLVLKIAVAHCGIAYLR